MSSADPNTRYAALEAAVAGKQAWIRKRTCAPAPIGCGRPWDPPGFRDALSAKEAQISGLCQSCQDAIFAEVPPEEAARRTGGRMP